MKPTNTFPRQPAAFINAISEEGTKEEAVRYLQETWDELCFYRSRCRTLVSCVDKSLLKKLGLDK